MIARVRIPSSWHNPGDHETMAHTQHAVADFSLGVGPCGKTVERLDVSYHAFGVEVLQVCTCRETKSFLYPWHTVTGRIEVTYA